MTIVKVIKPGMWTVEFDPLEADAAQLTATMRAKGMDARKVKGKAEVHILVR